MKNDNLIIENVLISNPNKKLFTNPDVTKKEIILYYQKVASRMLPLVRNRIISMIRCPDGTDGECFYKKHLGKPNQGLGVINLPSDKDRKEDYYYIKNLTGIIAEIQMNTIEIHIWGSKVQTLEKPDMLVFDLDPDEKLDLEAVRQGARDLKKLLDEIKLISFLKTSGGKGYHIVVPIQPSVNWKVFRDFAKNIAEAMAETWPDRYTTNIRKETRKNKIFIDWIRNTRTATSVAPYSVRTKKGAPVSMPIKWSELGKVKPNEITMNEAIKRLNRKDPWAGFNELTQSIK